MSVNSNQLWTWTCDCCRRVTKTKTNNQPKGWRHLEIRLKIDDSHVDPHQGKKHPAPLFLGDACAPCSRHLRDQAMRLVKLWRTKPDLRISRSN